MVVYTHHSGDNGILHVHIHTFSIHTYSTYAYSHTPSTHQLSSILSDIVSFSSERFCEITPVDLLEKVNLIPKRVSKILQRGSQVSSHSSQSLTLSFSDMEQQETSIEKLAFRFNQVTRVVCDFECIVL